MGEDESRNADNVFTYFGMEQSCESRNTLHVVFTSMSEEERKEEAPAEETPMPEAAAPEAPSPEAATEEEQQ